MCQPGSDVFLTDSVLEAADLRAYKTSEHPNCATQVVMFLSYVRRLTLFLNLKKMLYFMCVDAQPACVSVHCCVPGALGGWKRASELLELELQPVVGSHVGAGNRAWVLGKSSCCSWPLGDSPEPYFSL